jgi:hypothetical protein
MPTETMWPFRDTSTPLRGAVCYRGPLPPRLEQVLALAALPVTAVRGAAPTDGVSPWALELSHPLWGDATVTSPDVDVRGGFEDGGFAISGFTAVEAADASRAERILLVTATTPERRVLRARKHLLRWLRLLMALDGLAAFDLDAGVTWAPARLDDELAHDADLDVASLYTVDAVCGPIDPDRVTWLHTHGLEGIGAFDIDILEPSPAAALFLGSTPLRALAFAALEGDVMPTTRSFPLGGPDGDVALVPADTFQRTAAPEHAALRVADAAHAGRRAVVCDPAGRFSSARPRPSRFLATATDDAYYSFSVAACAIVAARAAATLPVFRELHRELAGPDSRARVKRYDPPGHSKGGAQARWLTIATFGTDTVAAFAEDGTLREFPFDDVADWGMATPAGLISPQDMSAARRLRESGWPDGRFASPRRE